MQQIDKIWSLLLQEIAEADSKVTRQIHEDRSKTVIKGNKKGATPFRYISDPSGDTLEEYDRNGPLKLGRLMSFSGTAPWSKMEKYRQTLASPILFLSVTYISQCALSKSSINEQCEQNKTLVAI